MDHKLKQLVYVAPVGDIIGFVPDLICASKGVELENFEDEVTYDAEWL